jgi:predicted Fe-Mo cluster-binding NifX family protein
MIIGITSTGSDLSAPVDARFGRARNFIIYDTGNATFSVHDNDQNLSAAQGAGIQAAQNFAKLNAEVLLTGNCGPKAFKVLSAAGVKVFSASNCTVQEAIDQHLKGLLPQLNNANVEGHWN